jgi:hypothetical protein
LEPAPVRRAYEHLAHAEEVLERATSSLDRVDVVTTLKRAVDHRLRLLNSYYKWKKLLSKQLPKGQLQILEAMGIARHRMVARLIDFRNQIEHGDEPPPESAACADLVEIVWYFLRSTDLLCLRMPTEVNFEFTSDRMPPLGVEVRLNPDQAWDVSCRAALPAALLSVEPHEDWFQLSIDWADEGQRFRPQPPTLTADRINAVVNGEDGILSFNGMISGPTDSVLRLIRACLTAP